jgi:tetratricopeptide (TPR) repeat protein
MQCFEAHLDSELRKACQEWKTHMEAGRMAFESGLFSAAARNYRRALSIVDDVNLGPEFRACTSLKMAQCDLKLGLLEEAEAMFKQVISLDQNCPDPHGYDVAVDMSELAMLYLKMGRLESAENLLVQAVQILETLGPKTAPDLAKALKNLGIVHCRETHYSDAEKCLKRAICLCSGFKNDQRLYSMILAAMSGLAAARGRLSEARELIEQAIEKLEIATGGQHPDLAKILELGSDIMNKNGLHLEAETYKHRADSIRRHVHSIDR